MYQLHICSDIDGGVYMEPPMGYGDSWKGVGRILGQKHMCIL